MIRHLCRFRALMHIKPCGLGRTEDRLRASHFLCGAVRHHQKAIGWRSR